MHYSVWALIFLARLSICLEKRSKTLHDNNYVRYECHGVIDDFGKEFLELMDKNYRPDRINHVMQTFYQQLNLIHNPYTKLLSKWFLNLKSMSYKQRRDYLQMYRSAMKNKKTALVDFCRVFNGLFVTKDKRKLNKFILSLRRYLQEDSAIEEDSTVDIDREIREVLHMIYDIVTALHERRQRYILARMRLALKAFNGVEV